MKRNPIRALLIGVAVLGASLLSPFSFPGDAQSLPTNCPEMTDSIIRLYRAYFGRDPDNSGFRHWVAAYQSGTASLADIADTFAQSDEFGDKRALSNEEFVDWAYATVVGPAVNTDRKGYWVRALDSGYPRGSLMLAFTESREFVAATNTAVPLAGYLRWYPRGTHWYCDVGPAAPAVNPLRGDQVWADYYFQNRGEQVDSVELWTVEADGGRNVQMVSNTLQPSFTDYNWDGSFSGDGDYGTGIEVQVGASTAWIVVFYPRSIGPDRLGWQIA
jgi:hypothetical protein